MATSEQPFPLYFNDSISWEQTLIVPHLNDAGIKVTSDFSCFIGVTDTKSTTAKLYFGKVSLEPFLSQCQYWKELFSTLYMACHGTKLLMYGTIYTKEGPHKKLCCYRCKRYQCNKTNSKVKAISSQQEITQFRPASVHNDYLNSGQEHSKRKGQTNRALDKESKCPFSFSFRARFRWVVLYMRWKRISWPLGTYGRSSLSKKQFHRN